MENQIKQTESNFKHFRNRAETAILKRPFTFFIGTLIALVALIGIASVINKPKIETKTEEKPAKEVTLFSIGSSPKIFAQASIRKSGIISIYAQTTGVVQAIYKKEGETVNKGANIFWISNTYTGGTISSLQRQLAQKNYEATKNNFSLNIDTIDKQREQAQLSKNNTEELRKITDKSVQENHDLLDLNNKMYRSVVDSVSRLEQNTSPSASDSAQITQLKGQQAQLSAAINQLMSATRNAQYQRDTNNPPAKLADVQYDLTMKQLELQERSTNLQLEINKLNYQVAQVSEGLNYPGSPVTGKVERINAIVGQTVSPGDLLAVVSTGSTSAIADAFVSKETALRASKLDNSILHIGKNTIEATPAYVSTQPTSGQLYSISYQIPTKYSEDLSNQSYIKVEIPLGSTETGATKFIPIDAVYQTQDGAYVYVVEKKDNKDIAKSKKIELGDINGNYVEVISGLTKDDKIIIDRNILEEDVVKAN